MDFASSRAGFNERLKSVRTLLSFIKEQESDATPPVDSESVKIMRGLFFVHLYGTLEKSLTELIGGLLSAIAQESLGANEYSVRFLPVALDRHFSAIGNAQGGNRFARRIEFSEVLSNNVAIPLNCSIFEAQLQNVKHAVVVDIMRALGLNVAEISAHPRRFYIDEVVEKRNQIAHGRANPANVGASGRSADLEERLESVDEYFEFIVQRLEDFFAGRYFKKR